MSSTGVATLVTTNLPIGLHGVHADYSGDLNDLTSHATITQTVNPANTATTLGANPLSTTFGKTVTLTVTVKRLSPATSTPDGTVTLYDNAQPLVTAPLTSGKAVIKTTTLSSGTHILNALYPGTSNYNGSQSPPVSITIT